MAALLLRQQQDDFEEEEARNWQSYWHVVVLALLPLLPLQLLVRRVFLIANDVCLCTGRGFDMNGGLAPNAFAGISLPPAAFSAQSDLLPVGFFYDTGKARSRRAPAMRRTRLRRWRLVSSSIPAKCEETVNTDWTHVQQCRFVHTVRAQYVPEENAIGVYFPIQQLRTDTRGNQIAVLLPDAESLVHLDHLVIPSTAYSAILGGFYRRSSEADPADGPTSARSRKLRQQRAQESSK